MCVCVMLTSACVKLFIVKFVQVVSLLAFAILLFLKSASETTLLLLALESSLVKR